MNVRIVIGLAFKEKINGETISIPIYQIRTRGITIYTVWTVGSVSKEIGVETSTIGILKCRAMEDLTKKDTLFVGVKGDKQSAKTRVLSMIDGIEEDCSVVFFAEDNVSMDGVFFEIMGVKPESVGFNDVIKANRRTVPINGKFLKYVPLSKSSGWNCLSR